MSMRVRSRASLGKTGQERYVVLKRGKFRWTLVGIIFEARSETLVETE